MLLLEGYTMVTVRQPSPNAPIGDAPRVTPTGDAIGAGRTEQLTAVLTNLAAHDPDVLLAVAEVDRSLIRLTLKLAPLERVRSAAASAATLARFRRVER
jgi:hypothetical protein